MEKFQWAQARTLEEVQEQVTATTSQLTSGQKTTDTSIIKAGGVDLLDLMKEGLATPEKMIDIKAIPGFKTSTYDAKKGLKIGAGVTLSMLQKQKEVKEHYVALYEAISHAATPQIRNMATIGGNMAQRTRCWYFRSEDHQCKKKGGAVCFAQTGQNDIHAIYNTSICPCVHSSSIATALMAFHAEVEYLDQKGKVQTVLLTDFFTPPEVDVTRENILKPKEIITAITIPVPSSDTKSYYIKQGARESYDWALADVAVALEIKGNTCKKAAIVLGAAAPIPFRATEAEGFLLNKTIDEDMAIKAAEMVLQKATPLSGNSYKIPMFKAIIKNCILKTIS
ncbi:FAD binding domain-containing protein [Aquimarina sp. ERC-38]|uniref:FAD binding domain-containing protein n=1 Tax=Aquimarina sp. ERC-38 TaxID=2949996 RepID=UPI002245AB14|nr:FAD binding domain-containing protein [Aquimarina sp. ERC-38]UZO81039.1 FAD binding domain-containing protein [Aquimarina sp. ERC-38]